MEVPGSRGSMRRPVNLCQYSYPGGGEGSDVKRTVARPRETVPTNFATVTTGNRILIDDLGVLADVY
jgi:hypothetical protein